METKKRLSEWTLAELSKYCKSMVEQDYPRCEKCEARGICERTPNRWKFDTLTDREKAIMRSCGAKWVTKDTKGKVKLWNKKPAYTDGIYYSYEADKYITEINESLFQSVTCGDCIELED